jgi:hypothetical protein
MADDTTITPTEIRRAVLMLSRSERGLNVIRDTLILLENGGLGLDQSGQVALFTLLSAAFTSHPGLARNEMRWAVMS